MPLLRRVVPLALVAALASPVAAHGAARHGAERERPATTAGIDSVTLEGHGFGHGNGMGQYGALGYAVDHSWTWQQIVAHFYGGTTAGTVANDDMTVRLTANDSQNLVVRSDSPFTVGGVPFAAGEAAKVERTGTSTFVVSKAAAGPGSCAGPWGSPANVSATVVEAVPSSPPPASSTDLTKLLVLCRGTEQRWYRGALRLVSVDGTSRTVNRIPLESYVQGVVPRESIPSWSTLGGGRGMEALEAQAVAARSYSLAENRYSYAKTCDSTSCQVYSGVAVKYGSGSVSTLEYSSTNAATASTAGAVRRTASGAVARTEFSTSSGGWTNRPADGNAFPAVVDDGDDTTYNPYHSWTATISASTIEGIWPAVGDLLSVEVTQRTGDGEWGGRAREIQLHGTSGTVTLACANYNSCPFRTSLGLKSEWFHVVGDEAAPVVSMDATDDGRGYWVLDADGAVKAAGNANVSGTTEQYGVDNVGIAQRPLGSGYWVASADGAVFSFGGAPFYGAGTTTSSPFVDITAHPDGTGYWMVRADGTVQAFSAGDFGGSGGTAADPVVDMDATENGGGYWTVDDEGLVRAYGNAQVVGRAEATYPVTAIAERPNGRGYWILAAGGDVFATGGAPFLGEVPRNSRVPVIDLVPTPTGRGYWLVDEAGTIYAYGDARLF
jgi:SpoIID/LytB domain protein